MDTANVSPSLSPSPSPSLSASLSIVVCTYQRAASLPRTLDSIAVAAQQTSAKAELVVVDNNSTDATPAVIDAFRRRAPLPVRTVFEPRQGHAIARNTGVAAARHDWIAFTDDDVTVAPDWLAVLAECAAEPGLAAVGGPILPAWEGTVPAWLTPRYYRHFAILDLGPQRQRLGHADIWGANFAVRAACFQRFGGFPTELGRVGGMLGVGEETTFLQRLIEADERIDYLPALQVHHHIPRDRLCRRFVLRHEFDRGRQEGRLAVMEGKGRPAWLLRMVGETAIAAALPGFQRQCRFAYWLGHALGRTVCYPRTNAARDGNSPIAPT